MYVCILKKLFISNFGSWYIQTSIETFFLLDACHVANVFVTKKLLTLFPFSIQNSFYVFQMLHLQNLLFSPFASPIHHLCMLQKLFFVGNVTQSKDRFISL